MSKELIAKARELGESITAGPWMVKTWQQFDPGSDIARDIVGVQSETGHVIAECWSGNADAEAEFIAESRALMPALADLAEQQACRLAAIDATVPISAARIKARLDGGTAGDNTLQAVHDIKELLAIVGQQASTLTAANASILKLRAEVVVQGERVTASELNAREQKGLADLAMQVVSSRTQELMVAEEGARVLANGIAAYRSGSFTLAQVWENEHGKTVSR